MIRSPLIFLWNTRSLGRVLAPVLAAAVLLLPSAAEPAEYNPARARPRTEQQNSVAQVIVKFRAAARVQAQAAASGESLRGTVADIARIDSLVRRARLVLRASRALGGDMHVLDVSPAANGEPVAETLARLQADSEVEYAVEDRRVYPHAVSNDPLASGQWYLGAAQTSAIRAQSAWDTTKGRRGVTVAVLDTGVLFGHPDLGRLDAGGRFLDGYDFVSPDSTGVFTMANDGDGRDVDPADPGDWVTVADGCGSSIPSTWHGTRVSGIIAALTDNGIGVAGVMWNATILPVRVLGKCGGRTSDVLAGMRWAAGLSVPGAPANATPARIINLSLGSQGVCDSASRDAIDAVTATGALVVVSAGNEGGPVESPGNCPGALAVLGLRHAGTKVGFSSLGPEIALGAPGGNCVNVTAGAPCLFSIDTTSNTGTTAPGVHTYTDQLDFNVGTSFSAPIVSGIAGLMLSVNGNLKSAQLIARLRASATPFPVTSDTGITLVCHAPLSSSDLQVSECICTTTACGAGMANASSAVNEALRPIAAISAAASFPAASTVTLQAGGSAGACGRAIAGYAWSVISGTGTLVSTTMATTSIQAPSSGTTTVQLVVTDDVGRTDTATITLGATTSSTVAPASAGTNACLPDEPLVNVVATDANAAEAGSAKGVFTLTRTGSTAAALIVNIALAGTALNGIDYVALANTAVIPAGQSSVAITLTPIHDGEAESPETAILTLQAGAGYAVGRLAAATVTITGKGSTGGGGALDLLTLCLLLAAVMRISYRRT